MRLNALTDYAMRLLIYVGSHPDRLCTIEEVASAHEVSRTHMMKVSQILAAKGWLDNVRGKHGGLRLARQPDAIRLGEVVRSTERDLQLVECFGAQHACRLDGQCGLAGILAGALERFLSHLDSYTLADLLPVSPRPPAIRAPNESTVSFNTRPVDAIKRLG